MSTMAVNPIKGKPLERRRANRVRCQFPAQLSIIFPDETFSPRSAIVLVNDVSHHGIKVMCPDLGLEGTERRIEPGQFVRLYFKTPTQSARMYCQIIWVKTRTSAEGRTHYELGLGRDPQDSKSGESISAFLERARESQAIHGLPDA